MRGDLLFKYGPRFKLSFNSIQIIIFIVKFERLFL
jgi:hypothetical protein